ncbi:hypothetical protein F4811DRAFT_564118 [Daldinia bambusicola]|nr:hypothetical protein F4811DRAFT_564118 [Daldinia bambusicola]
MLNLSAYGNEPLMEARYKGILPCGRAVGIYHFQVVLCAMLDDWYREWIDVLSIINEAVGVRFEDTQNDKRWDEFMFDTSFRLSRLYFTHGMYLERDFRLTDDEIGIIDKNWVTISSKMNSLAGTLKIRIERNANEVKSLRDGPFNATSLREADKAMAINRAIYVFTVVTIIYTPLGFMAVILNGSSNNESAVSWKAFISTFVLILTLTYIICPIAAWYFSLDSSRRSLDSENIYKALRVNLRRHRDSTTALPHKIKVWAFGDRKFRWRISRPAMDSSPPAQGIDLRNRSGYYNV